MTFGNKYTSHLNLTLFCLVDASAASCSIGMLQRHYYSRLYVVGEFT